MGRRVWLRSATALAAGRILGANDRVRIGLVGCGGRGTELLQTALALPEAAVVAVADVYQPFAERAVSLCPYPVAQEKSFERLLERRDVDAVFVATPDHWHAAMTILACQAGKDVYCEKPLSLTVREGRRMVEAARRHGRVVQTGSQQRSGKHYAEARQLIREGGIGPVHRVHAGFQRNIFPGLTPRGPSLAAKPELDWDAWLGPAPTVPYNPFRCIYNFRWFWDYSGGQMTNWGAHHLDIARWILDSPGPESVSGMGGRYALTDGGETPDVQQVTFQFPRAVVTWSASEIGAGQHVTLDIIGSKGYVSLLRSGFTVTLDPGNRKPVRGASDQDLTSAHVANFLQAVRSRKCQVADVEEGHRTAAMCHLGNIATRLGRSLRWDAATEQIRGDAEAGKHLARPVRKPWASLVA